MKNLRKSHWVLIVLSVLVLLGCIGMTGYLLFSNYQNVRLLKQAQNNFLRCDSASLISAEAQLQQLVRNDSDNEIAYVMLGAIAGKRKVYSEQVYYCYMAHRLNPLSEKNKEAYIRSLYYSRYFDRLENFLVQQSELTDSHAQLLLYAAGRNGNFNKYQHLWKERNGDNTLRQLAHLLFRKPVLKQKERLAALERIPVKDSLRQEILAAKAELYLEIGDIDNAEKMLQSASKLNPYAFAPVLGRFYASFRTLKLALTLFEKHLATYHDPVIALQTAEIYCLLKRSPEISKLRLQYQGDSGNQAMLLCYYFDAMNALIRNDMAALKEFLIPLRKNIQTPLALFMFFCADLHGKKTSAILESYTTLTTRRGYVDLQGRADDLVLDFLKGSLREKGRRDEFLLSLAKHLYERRKDLFAAKFILLSQKRSSSGSLPLLQEALERYPEDQGLLKIAIEYYLEQDLAECELLIGRYKTKFPAKAMDMLQYEIILASRKKDHELVSALFRKHFSPTLLREYWNFASSTRREKDLIFLSTRDKVYAPFCKALLLIGKGSRDAACDLLEKADDAGNQALVFFAARILAENGRHQAALRKYAALPENSPYQLDVLLNTAELFAEMGNISQALE